MGDLDDEELYETKKFYKAAICKKEEILALLEKWKTKYRISINEINTVKNYLEKGE